MADAQCILEDDEDYHQGHLWEGEDDVGESSSLHLQLLCSMVAKAPSNVLSAIKSAFQIKDHYPRLRQALLAGMQHHFWNLPDDLVLLALADDDTELELKSKTSWLWSSCLFKIGKPDLPALRCQESWVIWWSIELASLESGWCSQRGGGEV